MAESTSPSTEELAAELLHLNEKLRDALDQEDYDAITPLVEERGPIVTRLMLAHQSNPTEKHRKESPGARVRTQVKMEAAQGFLGTELRRSQKHARKRMYKSLKRIRNPQAAMGGCRRGERPGGEVACFNMRLCHLDKIQPIIQLFPEPLCNQQCDIDHREHRVDLNSMLPQNMHHSTEDDTGLHLPQCFAGKGLEVFPNIFLKTIVIHRSNRGGMHI